MGYSSFLGNHLEGQGQNVLEREGDGPIKGNCTSTNEKIAPGSGNFTGVVEPDRRSSKLESSENNIEKPSLEGLTGRKLFNRDDDENFVRSTQLSTKNKISGPQSVTSFPRVKSVSGSKSHGIGQKSKDGSSFGSGM